MIICSPIKQKLIVRLTKIQSKANILINLKNITKIASRMRVAEQKKTVRWLHWINVSEIGWQLNRAGIERSYISSLWSTNNESFKTN